MSTEILIIDDNSEIRIILEEILNESGYKTRLAANYNQALTEIDNAQNSLEYFSMLAICITAYIITIAGATPNETRSAIESNSAPNGEVAFSNLAASPSITSKIPHQTIIQAACSILP